MQEVAERVVADDDQQITDMKVRYKSGVLKYKQMGYWVPDYEVKDTDVLAPSASRRRTASTRKKPPPPLPASPPPRHGPSCGPTA